MALVWLKFGLCAALIAAAGYRLSRYGDIIAEKTGLGRTLVGLVLIATVTSLPELVTGISAVALAHSPDIAVGNVLGACGLNLAMIVVLDFLQRGESVYTRVSHGHILAAGFSLILIGIVGFSVLVETRGATPALAHVGLYSPLLAALYIFAMRTQFSYERRQIIARIEEGAARYPGVTLQQAALGYTAAAAVVVGAALWLPFVAEELAAVMGWRKTFVGTVLVAFATTLPEMAVTVSALRLGALDMAIGNLFGSNLFNIAIVAVDDLFYTEGPILAHVSSQHAVTALSAIVMTGIAIIGLLYRPAGRMLGTVTWASLLLLLVYLLNTYVLYLHG